MKYINKIKKYIWNIYKHVRLWMIFTKADWDSKRGNYHTAKEGKKLIEK